MIKIKFINPTNCDTIRFAQQELEAYLKKMLLSSSDEESSINITFTVDEKQLSNSKLEPQLDDAFYIKASPDNIRISASNPRSVLLGVYKLLSELGCRFLIPGRSNEFIPHISKSQLRTEVSQSASFRHRGVCIEGANSLENVLDFIDWLPKNGYNSFFVQHFEPESFLNNWYLHTFNPIFNSERLSDSDKKQMYREIDRALSLRSLLHHRVGHGWTCKAIGFEHACVQAPPPSSDQKRLLAEINGERVYFGGIPSNTNLCYSEPEARQIFVNAVTEYASSHLEVDYLHVWLADECNNVCECEKCRQTTPSDLYVRLLNDIDKALSKKHLRTRIVMLLYTELLWPPKTENLTNPDRFTLMFAPITRTFEKSYAECGEIKKIPTYVRNHIQLPNTLEENIAFLRAWQNKCSIDSFDYDYPLGRAHYGDLGYHHIARIISEDIKSLDTLGLNGYISCQELRAAFPNAFPGYVMGHTLWDKNISFKTLEEEYYSALYGTQWTMARDYLARLSQLCSCNYFNGIGSRTDNLLAKRFRQAYKYVCSFHPNICDEIGRHTNIQQTAWRLLDYHAEYCKLLLKALAALAAGQTEKAKQAWTSVMYFIRSHEKQYQPYFDVYRLLEVATKYTGFELDMPR